ncbi:BTB/POZ protein [Gigaspora rosea]|uniref:BTB/POZ protein n=1 Tax=Gigaspora rosea TaxID=44941 RepID=A0A397V7T8_9GLOM|nr:BTB/POZ protein [Gigaspora rosea]
MIKNFIQNFNIPSTTSLTSFATPPNTSYLSTSITSTINTDTNNNNIDNSDERSSILTESLAAKEKIVLNVGGIKYETYRSTLTSYPTTLLGSIFVYNDHENPFWDSDLDEFFIDRDGHLFHYIMQFYRTGKVPTIDQGSISFIILFILFIYHHFIKLYFFFIL